MVAPTLAHSLGVHETKNGFSLQNDREMSSASGGVPLERLQIHGDMRFTNGGKSHNINRNFGEFLGVRGFG